MNTIKEITEKNTNINELDLQNMLELSNNIPPSQTSTAALAFLGDAVYSLLVRQWLAESFGRAEDLHSAALKYVSAVAQSKSAQKIIDSLSSKEFAVFKRGRNMHTANKPKNASEAEYHNATALEVLFGYLYLSKDFDRLKTLFEKAVS